MATPNRSLKFLILSAKGGGTGCALRAFYIAEALKKRGHQVEFVKPLPSLPFWFDMALSTFYYFYRSLFLKVDVAMAIKPYPTVVPALWVQKLKGAKVALDVDDLDYDYSHGWFKTLHKAIELPWPSWADFVTYHNPHLREPLGKVFGVNPLNMVHLDQGVDSSVFYPGPMKTEDLPPAALSLRKRKGAGPILTFTAHLSLACDLEPLLESLKTIRHSLPQVHLLVAGGGPDEGRFKRLAAELDLAPSVHFTGYLTPRQVAACLKLSDAAMVYYRETPVNLYRASMKLREAVACGCRVVATNVGEAIHWKNRVHLASPEPRAFAQTVLKTVKTKRSTRQAHLLVKKLEWTQCVQDLEERSFELCGH